MEEKIKKLVELGGKEWKGYDKHYVYFNRDAIFRLAGVEVGRYNSGNIAWIAVKGKGTSNNFGGLLLTAFQRGSDFKVFYDVAEGKFKTSGYAHNRVLDFLQGLFNQLEAQINKED